MKMCIMIPKYYFIQAINISQANRTLISLCPVLAKTTRLFKSTNWIKLHQFEPSVPGIQHHFTNWLCNCDPIINGVYDWDKDGHDDLIGTIQTNLHTINRVYVGNDDICAVAAIRYCYSKIDDENEL